MSLGSHQGVEPVFFLEIQGVNPLPLLIQAQRRPPPWCSAPCNHQPSDGWWSLSHLTLALLPPSVTNEGTGNNVRPTWMILKTLIISRP